MSLFRKPNGFEFPGPRDRVAVCGATGSGKSTFALWLFSESADFHKKPWILIDFKGEDIIRDIIRAGDAEIIRMDKALPTRAGIYVVQPKPQELGLVADFLWKVYARGRIGLFFDEMTMIPNFHNSGMSAGPFRSILTQGRSKEIPVYGLTQRPVAVDIHIFSEAQFISEFYLKKVSDRERVAEYVPDEEEIFSPKAKPVPRYWSRWWDDKRRVALILKPAPPASTILDTIGRRMLTVRSHRKL